jgi:hypothetical protein
MRPVLGDADGGLESLIWSGLRDESSQPTKTCCGPLPSWVPKIGKDKKYGKHWKR